MDETELDLTGLTANIVSSYVTHNVVAPEKLPEFIGSIHTALAKAAINEVEPPRVELKPAVPVKKSVGSDHIVCLEDGLKFKSLKRHLQSHHGLSATEYREKWGLPNDYPMVAPGYAAQRSELAKSMGLGRRNGTEALQGSNGTAKPSGRSGRVVAGKPKRAIAKAS